MASLIPGYEYDIFISYRQKDNRYDGWVTEFVEHLEAELESTFKEEVSVYFDINSHDGLLETHDVNASLKEKLKCLVFMPIISRTYCDPKSYAWEHEFKAFIELASQDQFGLKIKLPNGNVASRVLPVQIHDLDPEDKNLLEFELGGVLRSIEFSYKSSGVNRPLHANEDHQLENINRTYYRNQINKVANAVKEIIFGITNLQVGLRLERNAKRSIPDNLNVTGINNTSRKSIIVLPFSNLSPNSQDEYFSDGLTEEIIANLAHLRSLRVISRSTSMVFKGTFKDIITIGRELDVEYVLEGSVRKAENKIRITAQLIDARSDEHILSERFDGSLDDIFDVQDKIARRIVDALKIELSPEEKMELNNRSISNPKAYDLWILAKNEFHKLSKEGIERGILLTEKALEIEGDNAQLFATLGYLYWAYYDMGIKHETGIFDLMEQCVSKSLSLDPNHVEALSVKGLILYKQGDLQGYVRCARPAADLGGEAQYLIPFVLAELGKLDEADVYAEKALTDNPLMYMPAWSRACVDLFMGKTQKAYKLMHDTRDRLAPGEPFVGWWLAQMAAYAGDKETAYKEFKIIALTGSSPWREFCKLFQLALESNTKEVKEHIKNSGIEDFSKTDEYYPIFIANALALVGEYEEALVWLKRSIDFGFSNYKFLLEFNEFIKPLKTDPRFQALIEKARQQQESFID